MEKFYKNQIDAAIKIIKEFEEANYAVLLAEMQSGKSDTFMLAAAELVRKGIIKQFVVISGNAETALRDQAKNQTDFWRKYEDYLYELLGEGRETRVRARLVEDTWNDKSVIWASQLLKWTRTSDAPTLFIWDESHFAQSGPSEKCSKGNRPYQFFEEHGLNVTGDAHVTTGDLMLSVSATPFSEVIANKTTSPKPVVYMEPGEGYRGLAKMLEDDQIVSYEKSEFDSEFRRLALEVKDEGVGIVRATGTKAEDLKTLCIKLGVRVKVHDITDSNDINWYLGGGTQDHPLTGVIIVKGKVKMGKQLKDKSRIRWCMETADCPNTDTFLQGLTGRCMGYEESGTHKDIKIYVSAKYYRKGDHKEYIKMMKHFSSEGSSKLELPSRAMNVVEKPVPALNYKSTIPERIDIDISDWDDTKVEVKTMVKSHLKKEAKENFILTTPNNESVKAWEKKHGDYVAEMHSASETNSLFNCPFPQEHKAKVWLVGCPANPTGNPKVFVDYVRALVCRGEKMVVYVQYRGVKCDAKELVVKTTGDEVFSNQPKIIETIEENGTSPCTLPRETSDSVEAMKNGIDYMVGESIDNPKYNKPFIKPNIGGRKGIAVTPEVFAAIKSKGEIYKYILEKHDVRLKVRKVRGRRPTWCPAKYVRIEKIEW